ncbi:hypothetical protein [Shewanella sp. Shew256]|uniref:hypothetical protein n=1 Tax=Shewanella sp. Shew256 TaxID=1969376 RepID=UPI000B49ED2B|nr:hypothetical protein [Shewanella sp. Shew256]
MDAKFDALLKGFYSEANLVCGSEGVFQSIFYHEARKYFDQSQIWREQSVNGGAIDFCIDSGEKIFAIEIKAGANGHRNSLAKMKEVESKGKGLSHDLSKLQLFASESTKPVETWLICVDLSPLGIAFNKNDIIYYSELASSYGANFSYASQLESLFYCWYENGKRCIELNYSNSESVSSIQDLLSSGRFWSQFFDETVSDFGPECSHVGLLYHHLRKSGLNHNQVAVEIFFNCNKYGDRKYRIPDLAIFDRRFNAQFQLYGDSKKIVKNDQFKLPSLVSVIEFKGGSSFISKPLSERERLIEADIDKMLSYIIPNIKIASLSFSRDSAQSKPIYILVVTDFDKRLELIIFNLRQRVGGKIDIRWIGDYL